MSKHALPDVMGDGPVERSFEWLRETVGSLSGSPDPSERTIVWADARESLAVARDHRGRLEVFVVGEELVATVPIIRDCLEFQAWQTSTGKRLEANRFVFPNAPHFDGVAAFVCAELLSNGWYEDPKTAFARTEAVLALALRRAALSDEVLLGLAGELVVLDALTRRAAAGAVAGLVDSWSGSVPSTRDFQLCSVGVEVKTTTGPSSHHHVQGVYQVELGVPVGGVPETALFLLSIGVRWLEDPDASLSVPSLVETICGRTADLSASERFLAKVRQYGGDGSLGYDHAEHQHLRRFRRPFEVRFERLYDMTDDDVRVLRSENLDGLSHVEESSVTFRVVLPTKVRGDVNPTTGMHSIVDRILRLAEVPLRAVLVNVERLYDTPRRSLKSRP